MNKLKLCRLLTEKTPDQLMAETGIHQTKISRIENGYLKPNEREKYLLARELGCKPRELFELENPGL